MKFKLLQEVKVISGKVVPIGTVYENNEEINPSLFSTKTDPIFSYYVGLDWNKTINEMVTSGAIEII